MAVKYHLEGMRRKACAKVRPVAGSRMVRDVMGAATEGHSAKHR